MGFAQIGAILAVLLTGCWVLAYSLGVRVSKSQRHAGLAMAALVLGAFFGIAGLLLGLLVGPHLASICIWGVAAQLFVLLVGRAICAI